MTMRVIETDVLVGVACEKRTRRGAERTAERLNAGRTPVMGFFAYRYLVEHVGPRRWRVVARQNLLHATTADEA